MQDSFLIFCSVLSFFSKLKTGLSLLSLKAFRDFSPFDPLQVLLYFSLKDQEFADFLIKYNKIRLIFLSVSY